MSEENQRRLIALLLGLATIMAGVFTWRAGQLGSTAAYADRTSIGQTIKQEQENIETGFGAVQDAEAYVRYTADYATASALDAQADELDAQALALEGETQPDEPGEAGDPAAGDPAAIDQEAADGQGASDLAEADRDDADGIRLTATLRAAAAGVFGRQAVYNDIAQPQDTPRSFDLEKQIEILRNEAATGITSPGPLDPAKWATTADDIRHRVRVLRIAAFVLLVAVVLLTIAEMTDRRITRIGTAGASVCILLGVSAATVATVW